MSAKGMLIDVNLCEGCGECVRACHEANGLPEVEFPEEVRKLSDTSFCCLEEHNDRYVRKMCMHCEAPTCASVCPVGAFHKTPEGPVIWDEERCIGCRYCIVACPFDVPKYEWESNNPKVRKCIFCYERQKEGKPPACAAACPAEATMYGDRDEMLKLAHERIAEDPDSYRNGIFGEAVVGGTSMLFIGNLAPRQMGFPDDLPDTPLRQLTHVVMSKIPGAVIIGGAFLLGMNWLTRRKNEIAALDQGAEDEER